MVYSSFLFLIFTDKLIGSTFFRVPTCRGTRTNQVHVISAGVIKIEIAAEDGFGFILLLGWRNVCHFLVLQMAKWLESKAIEAFLAQSPIPPVLTSVIGRFCLFSTQQERFVCFQCNFWYLAGSSAHSLLAIVQRWMNLSSKFHTMMHCWKPQNYSETIKPN